MSISDGAMPIPIGRCASRAAASAPSSSGGLGPNCPIVCSRPVMPRSTVAAMNQPRPGRLDDVMVAHATRVTWICHFENDVDAAYFARADHGAHPEPIQPRGDFMTLRHTFLILGS